MLNAMCKNCARLGIDCKGTTCQTWTGCIYKENVQQALKRMRAELSELKELNQQYQAIGTVIECQEAMDNQTAKKPNVWGDGSDSEGNIIYDMYDCPNCGKSYEIDYHDYKFCPECGQAIDRSDLDNFEIFEKKRKDENMGNYTVIGYELYEYPQKPTDNGKYYGKTPFLEQAETIVINAKKCGTQLFIKAVCRDGKKRYL